MMLSTVQILKNVKNILKSEQKWAKGNRAQDMTGTKVNVHHKDASKFCILGAIHRVMYEDGFYFGTDVQAHETPAAFRIRKVLKENDYYVDIARFNDKANHGELMEVLDLAIASRS
jgi:hypothetical protein